MENWVLGTQVRLTISSVVTHRLCRTTENSGAGLQAIDLVQPALATLCSRRGVWMEGPGSDK